MSVDRILLKGGCVLTLDPDIGNYRQADVLIEGTYGSLRDPTITRALSRGKEPTSLAGV